MMKSFLSFFFLLTVLESPPVANAIGAEMSPYSMDRELQIADWGVTIDSVGGQVFAFTVAAGGGLDPTVLVHVYDKCRIDGAQISVGYFFGGTDVPGIVATPTTVGSSQSGSIALSFVEGIEQNTNIYTQSGDATTATVKLCAEVGLYDDIEANLVNFAEVELEYTIDLVTDFAALTGYAVSQAGAFTDTGAESIEFDGNLEAYFCDKAAPTAALTNAAGISIQGSEISVCFRAPDGQFEVKDIISLSVEDTDSLQSQDIVVNSALQNGTDATPLAVSVLTDTSNADTNVVVASFLLYANFFDTAELILNGTGTVLLELGDAPANRYLRKVDLRILNSATTEAFKIAEQEFTVEQDGGPSSAFSLASSVVAFGASFVAAMAL